MSHGSWVLRQGNNTNKPTPKCMLTACAHLSTHTALLVQRDGKDQNNGVIKLDSVNGKTDAAKQKCLRKCLNYQSQNSKKVTGCEVIWNRNNRGCYGELAKGRTLCRFVIFLWFSCVCMMPVCLGLCLSVCARLSLCACMGTWMHILAVHTAEIHRGNRQARHNCWVFRKCSETTAPRKTATKTTKPKLTSKPKTKRNPKVCPIDRGSCVKVIISTNTNTHTGYMHSPLSAQCTSNPA